MDDGPTLSGAARRANRAQEFIQMIVHRILNVVFRTLDAVDAVRARVDSALGKHAEQPSSWPPQADPVSASRVDLEGEPASDPIASARVEIHAAAPAATMQKEKVKKAKTPQKAAAKAAVKPSKPTLRQPAPGRKKRAGAARKGSVDRKGVDVDSPRARAIQTFLKDNGTGVVTQDASLDSKKTVARVLWAVAVAEAAGSAQGLTAADASALLSCSAGLEVFSTNVARAFRDEHKLFEETVPDGRSKRYKLTAFGRTRAATIATR